MFFVDRLLLIAAVLILIGIASSKFSSRVGLPVLALFSAVGMLAREEGLGGIEFENYALAHGIGTHDRQPPHGVPARYPAVPRRRGLARTDRHVRHARTARVPSRVLDVAGDGLIVAFILIFVARPLAVGMILPWFGFRAREVVFVSWVGLKGAVPIVLATYPLLFGLEGASVLFNVVFFTVLVSAVLQGWTLPPVARWLRLQVEAPPPAPISLEITSLRDVEGDIVEYTVTPESRAADRHVRDLRLPDGAVVAMLVRAGEIIPPRGSTLVHNGDHVFLVLRPGLRPLVDRIFRQRRDPVPIPTDIEFPLRGDTTVAELGEFYGIELDGRPDASLHEVLRERLEGAIEPGSRLRLAAVDLVVRSVADDYIEQVGLVIRVEGDAADGGG